MAVVVYNGGKQIKLKAKRFINRCRAKLATRRSKKYAMMSKPGEDTLSLSTTPLSNHH
jgi:hypothetical protein